MEDARVDGGLRPTLFSSTADDTTNKPVPSCAPVDLQGLGRTTPNNNVTGTEAHKSESSEMERSHLSSKPTVIDLFCGAGGMGLGFMEAGFHPVLAIDNDRYSIETHKVNFPGESICSDIRTVESFPKADVVIGGPPCQGFSRLGKQTTRERVENFLWEEFMRCVETVMPSAFVVENVPEFFKDPAFAGISNAANQLGYHWAAEVVNAADYGVPQRRQRAILIGSKISQPRIPDPTHTGQPDRTLFNDLPKWRTLQDAIGDLPLEPSNINLHNSRNVSPLSLERYRHIPPGGNRKDLPPHLQPDCWRNKDPRGGGSTDLMGRLTWDAPSLTIRTQFLKPEKGRYLHPEADRSITVREGARLQTFPDDFKFEGSTFQIVKQIGNAVPVDLAAKIAKSILGHIQCGTVPEDGPLVAPH